MNGTHISKNYINVCVCNTCGVHHIKNCLSWSCQKCLMDLKSFYSGSQYLQYWLLLKYFYSRDSEGSPKWTKYSYLNLSCRLPWLLNTLFLRKSRYKIKYTQTTVFLQNGGSDTNKKDMILLICQCLTSSQLFHR